jgi:DNA-directed RNA polymerase-4/5 subunit 2
MEELVDDTTTVLGRKDKVFLNGDWVGVCSDSTSFVAELRNRRRKNELPHQVHFYFIL